MATRSTKVTKPAAKPVSKTMAAKRPVTSVKAKKPVRKVSSKQAANSQARAQRTRFVAKIVVVAAALVAISLGLMTYRNNHDTTVSVTPGQGVIFLQTSGSTALKTGSTIQVGVYEASGNEPINALQSAILYPSDRLEVVNVATATAFPQEAATDTATPGLVRIARSITTQSPAVTGTKQIATISFKVLKDGGSLQLSVDQDRSLLARSTDNQNILVANTSRKLQLK